VQTLSRSLFGSIKLFMDRKTKSKVVVKVSDKIHANKGMTVRTSPRPLVHVIEDVYEEARLLAKINVKHPGFKHICQLKAFIESSDKYLTVLEYCSGGDLFAKCDSPRGLKDVQRNFYQMVQGVDAIHSSNIAHLDLSLENVLLTEKGDIKICDFGMARECTPSQMLTGIRPGKLKYMAPEVFENRVEGFNGHAADMWSLGACLFLMLTTLQLYETPSTQDPRYAFVARGQLETLLRGWGYHWNDESAADPSLALPTEGVDLLCGLLDPNPKTRWTISQVLQHQYTKVPTDTATGSIRPPPIR